MEWKKLLLATGGAAAGCAVLYYLLKETEASKKPIQRSVELDDDKKSGGKTKVDEITKQQVREILQEIIASQEKMKVYMKDLTKELHSKSLNFEQTYKRVKEVQPNDPLEKYGLTMQDFDFILDKHQNDPNVRDAITKIMGAPNLSNCASEKVQQMTVKKIIEVHTFMLAELEKLVQYFQQLPNKDSYDLKTVTIAAQAIVGFKIEEKFSITSEDIESAVLMYHTMLATDQEFAEVNIKIQQAMGMLMGSPFTGS